MSVTRKLGIILLAFMLQGCIGAVLVGSAAVAGKVATDPRSVGGQIDDETLELRVGDALSKDAQLRKEARVLATAYEGRVLLVGETPTPLLSKHAAQIAAGVAGVTAVYNEIRISKPISFGTISNDTWVTTKVKSQLLASDKVKASNVKVTTENSEVFLIGKLTRAEAEEATNIARNVAGVRRVVKVFEYLN
ncbi:MAG: division/outer membrane stress-associated lipid-binding lipoprotein [Plesiomonas sp.]|uniref:division/outer membrane stress-associated lipid-binding lipoprotein n=1 Tax=Plesiomonas sp. TaxID=2486279 RepID=UPI003F2F7763